MCSFQSKIKNLKKIGTDQEMAIYNGFASQISDLDLLLCRSTFTREKFPNQTLKKVLQEKSLLTFMGVKMVASENMA